MQHTVAKTESCRNANVIFAHQLPYFHINTLAALHCTWHTQQTATETNITASIYCNQSMKHQMIITVWMLTWYIRWVDKYWLQRRQLSSTGWVWSGHHSLLYQLLPHHPDHQETGISLKTEIRTQHTASSSVSRSPLTLTFDPKIDAFIFVPKRITADSLAKFSPVIFKTTR